MNSIEELSTRITETGRFQLQHGHATRAGFSKTYISWTGMTQRCNYPKSISYRNYGAKGIRVCERWKSFSNFLADMGERPDGFELDRIDNTKDYSPENCRWSSVLEGRRNTSRTIQISFAGETRCLRHWCAHLGLKYGMTRQRIKRGWTALQALELEPRKSLVTREVKR